MRDDQDRYVDQPASFVLNRTESFSSSPPAVPNDTPPPTEPVSDALFETAARWHARLREPDSGAATRRDFAAWRLRDARHAVAFAEVERLWGRLDVPAAAWPAPQAQRTPRRRFALAASLVLGFVVASLAYRGGVLDTLRADETTAVGERRELVLDDGSRVSLNTDSALLLAFSAGERRVHLLRGEAYFEVRPDAARPFVVETRDGQTRVVGTAFNLRVRDTDTQVAVGHGRVEIATAADPQTRVLLTPGDVGSMRGEQLAREENADLAALTAWRQRRIVFYRAPLREVIAELDRYHRGRILVLNPELQALPVTGAFDLQRPQATLQLIEKTLNLHSRTLTPLLTVLF